METNEEIHHICAILTVVGIMTLALVAALSNNAFAQTVHNRTLYEVVKQTTGLQENAQISVGKKPYAIDKWDGIYDLSPGTLYVLNSGSDTVSVISAETNTKIKDIPVGNFPISIGINEVTNTLYVLNSGSDTVSVISAETNTKIKDIPVGEGPIDIYIEYETSYHTGYVYVVNMASDTVSVISIENNTKIKDIPVGVIEEDLSVGDFPKALDVGFGHIYVANSLSDTVSIISERSQTKIKDIPVGDNPSAIIIYENVYVANSLSDTVSVISPENNTKIKDIPVGNNPTDIGISYGTSNTIYVVNSGSDTVSVISPENNTKIKDIPVGNNPIIARQETYLSGGVAIHGYLYVANSLSDTVSVISPENNTKIKDIPVGNNPSAIGIITGANTVYVANQNSDSISIIDGFANEVLAGIVFHVNPLNSGYILCDGLTTPSPVGQYTYVFSGAECIAKPNEGFEFVSWEENLEDNSTQLITLSPSASPLDSIAYLFGYESADEPESKLNVTKFGTFTANFKELPPALPSEYLIPLYGIIISTIVGWSIPSIIGWARSKADARKLNYYHKRISSLYGDGKLDENDIEPLNRLRSSILDAYSQGKINEKHYQSLRNETSTLYEEIFRKKIDSLNHKSSINKITKEQLAQIRNEVEYAYSKGRIIQKHYDLLNKAISNLDSKERDTTS